MPPSLVARHGGDAILGEAAMGWSMVTGNDEGRRADRVPRLLRLISSLALALSFAVPVGVIWGPAEWASANAYGNPGVLPFYGLAGLAGTAVDSAGNVYVASQQSNLVLKLTPAGVQETLPFTGLDGPYGVAVDGAGTVFVTNIGGDQILKLTTGGVQSTLPFSGLSVPSGVAVDSAGNVFVSSLLTNAVVKLTPAGVQSTLGFTGLNNPYAVAVDSVGSVFVANLGSNTVLKLTAGGVQSTLGFTGLNAPAAVAVDAAGNVFVAELADNRVRKLTPGGVQSTLGFTGLVLPAGVAVDAAGNVFVASYVEVLKLSAGGAQSTLGFVGLDGLSGVAVNAAGDVLVANERGNQVLALTAGSRQQALPFAGLDHPVGVAVNPVGDVFVANKGSDQVLELTSGGTQTTLGFAGLNAPQGVAVDSAGNVFVANTGSNQVLKLTPGGAQTTLGFTGLNAPYAVAINPAGDVFVANTGSNQVLKLTPGGTQQTLPFVGLDGPAGLAIDATGNVFVANYDSNQVHELPLVITDLYAAPAALGTGSCNDAANACTLTTAVARANSDHCTLPGCPADTIHLVTAGTPGSPSTYYAGNWTLNNIFATTPITLVAEPGLARPPILDSGANGTATLRVLGGTQAAVDGLIFQHGTGAIENLGVLTVSDSTFTDNDAGLGGAGGAIENVACVAPTLTVTNSTFTRNSAGIGGAIANGFGCSTGVGTVTVSDSTFTDNTSAKGGAIANGIDSAHGTLTVTGSTFTRNSSTLDNGGPGGAIANGSSGHGDATVTNSAFTDNASGGNGGAIDNIQVGGTLTVSGSTFSRNTGANGGAISSGGRNGTGPLTVSGSTFTDNRALGDGGAIDSGNHGTASDLTVSDSSFSGNSATQDGGAIANDDNYGSADVVGRSFTHTSTLTVSRSTFTGNSSGSYAGNGGAIDNSDHGGSVIADATAAYSATPTGLSTSTMTVSGSTFTGNSTTGDGGAINTGGHGGSATATATGTATNTFVATASNTTSNALTVSDSTFSGNSAAGGGAIDNGDHGGSATATAITTIGGVVFTATATNETMNALTVSGSTFANNSTTGDGGAINNGDHGGNATATGNGIRTATASNRNPLTLWNSTFAGNSAARGGAVDNGDHGGSATAANTLTVWDTTFTGNTAGRGGVIDNGDDGSGTVYAAANIFDGTCLRGSGPSSWLDGGYNAGSDASCENGGAGDSTALTSAQLGPLGSHGGPTETVLPLAGNPARGIVPASTSVMLNGNSVTLCPVTDQRGVASMPGNCNAGAVQNNTVAPPTVSVTHTADGSSGWNIASPVSVSVSGLSATSTLAGLTCTVDGSPATLNPVFVPGNAAYTGSVSVSGDGVHPVTCDATDTAGNAAVQDADTVKLDTVAPDTSILTHPASPTNSTGGAFTFTGNDATSDVASYQCELDAGGHAPCVSGHDFGAVAEGSHTLSVRAVDDAGNKDAAPATFSWVVDLTEPNSSIMTSGAGTPANPTSSTSATFTFGATDPVSGGASSGVNHLECKLDSAAFAACTSTKSYSGIGPGPHTFKVRAVDNAGNVESTPDSFAWQVHAATTLLYNGDQIVVVGNTFKPAGLLSSPAAVCASGQPVTFSLDRNPNTNAAGSYSLGSVNTNGSGQATLSSISTTGWLEGVYDITASSAGSASCEAASYTASVTVAGPGDAANGGGWYTASGSGRINFGFTVSKVPNANPARYKGQAVIQNNGKWRLKGTLNSYVKVASKMQGSASGIGDLSWWDLTLNGGLGGWRLAKPGVAFTMTFTDVGSGGKNSTDTMGVSIQYTPVSPEPSTMPNSSPQPLKGGNVKVS